MLIAGNVGNLQPSNDRRTEQLDARYSLEQGDQALAVRAAQHATFALTEAAKAHQVMDERANLGRVLLAR